MVELRRLRKTPEPHLNQKCCIPFFGGSFGVGVGSGLVFGGTGFGTFTPALAFFTGGSGLGTTAGSGFGRAVSGLVTTGSGLVTAGSGFVTGGSDIWTFVLVFSGSGF